MKGHKIFYKNAMDPDIVLTGHGISAEKLVYVMN